MGGTQPEILELLYSNALVKLHVLQLFSYLTLFHLKLNRKRKESRKKRRKPKKNKPSSNLVRDKPEVAAFEETHDNAFLFDDWFNCDVVLFPAATESIPKAAEMQVMYEDDGRKVQGDGHVVNKHEKTSEHTERVNPEKGRERTDDERYSSRKRRPQHRQACALVHKPHSVRK